MQHMDVQRFILAERSPSSLLIGSRSCLVRLSPPSAGPLLSIPFSSIVSWTSLLHCPSSHSSSLPSSSFISSSRDVQRGVGGCAEQAISDSCDALLGGHWQSWLVSPPFLPQCCFSFPLHIVCLMCSHVQHFLKMD